LSIITHSIFKGQIFKSAIRSRCVSLSFPCAYCHIIVPYITHFVSKRFDLVTNLVKFVNRKFWVSEHETEECILPEQGLTLKLWNNFIERSCTLSRLTSS